MAKRAGLERNPWPFAIAVGVDVVALVVAVHAVLTVWGAELGSAVSWKFEPDGVPMQPDAGVIASSALFWVATVFVVSLAVALPFRGRRWAPVVPVLAAVIIATVAATQTGRIGG